MLGLLRAALLRHGKPTVALLGIIAAFAGARSARLVSLEAAAALTGRLFDRTLCRHRLCCTSTARSTVAFLGIIAAFAGAQSAPCCTSTARSTIALLGIIAAFVGARSARLVSLEAAAASTGRLFDRTLYQHRLCCTSTARFTVALLGLVATLAGARLARLCSSRSRHKQLSLTDRFLRPHTLPASSLLHFYGKVCGRAPRHHRNPQWCAACSARLTRGSSSYHWSLLRPHALLYRHRLGCTSTARIGIGILATLAGARLARLVSLEAATALTGRLFDRTLYRHRRCCTSTALSAVALLGIIAILAGARSALCCTSTARSTIALLGIIAAFAGARSARLVSLEAAAASTGRFVDRTLYQHRLCCTSTALSMVALLGIIAIAAGARSALCCTSTAR